MCLKQELLEKECHVGQLVKKVSETRSGELAVAGERVLKVWHCYLHASFMLSSLALATMVQLNTQPKLSRRQCRWMEYLQMDGKPGREKTTWLTLV